MQQRDQENIVRILGQYYWPIHLSYQTKSISNITEGLVEYHTKNLSNIDNYTISDFFSLYSIIEYALNELWEDEFNTVTGLDLYQDGYPLLNSIKMNILRSRT